MQVTVPHLTQEKADHSLGQEQKIAAKGAKGKGGKSFSKIFEENAKRQDRHSTKTPAQQTAEKNGPFAFLFHYLYDLAYRDRAEWTLAEREHYGVEKDSSFSLNEFHRMLSERNLNPQNFSTDHLLAISRLNTRRQLTAFLDRLMEEIQWKNDGRASSSSTSLRGLKNQQNAREEQIIKEIVKQISLRRVKEGTEVNIILNPGELGEVKLGIVMGENGVAAQFKTRKQEIKEILESHLGELAQSLSQQGIRVKTLTVQKIS